LRSNPVEAAQPSPAQSRPVENHSIAAATVAQTVQKSHQQPRNSRVETNTTRDLADYLRSTGPAKEEQLPQPVNVAGVSRPDAGGRAISSDGVPRAPPASNRQSASAASRLKFQARDARPTKGRETADLIDFIREGPPRAAGDHRIDRKVAPFRTTMDSDDLQALAPPGDFTGRSSVGSTHESSATKSMPESTNSRTALLETNRQNPVRNIAPPINHDVKRQVIPEQDGMPQRTRRRIRDPYAIDFSDEDELEEEEEPVSKPQPRKQEESLIDFLRNTAPPPGSAPQPILTTAPRPNDNKADLKRSTSQSKLRDMLMRDGSTRNATAVGVNGARESSPRLHAANGANRTPASAGDGVRKPKFQARDAKTTKTSTSDLADYLLNSGPSESTHSLPNERDPRLGHNAVKEQAGFMRFFSRKGSVRQ
jgi:hypothetical protein